MKGTGIIVGSTLVILIAAGCILDHEAGKNETNWTLLRIESLPVDVVKVIPEDDLFPPLIHGDE